MAEHIHFEPCPFCSSSLVEASGLATRNYRIFCHPVSDDICIAQGVVIKTNDLERISAWNNRPDMVEREVKIRPLEWSKSMDGTPVALGLSASYCIESNINGFWFVFRSDGSTSPGGYGSETEEDAKRAAYDHECKRILSALLPTTRDSLLDEMMGALCSARDYLEGSNPDTMSGGVKNGDLRKTIDGLLNRHVALTRYKNEVGQ